MPRVRLVALLTMALLAESAPMHPLHSQAAAPRELLGRFTDDYGDHFNVTPTVWEQLPHGKFHIVEWNVAERFFVARNDSANKSAPGKWTRIDWMPFTGMAPWRWGFCMTAFEAPTREAARRAPAPDRAYPRKGCNNFPFSRMRPDTAATR